MNRVTDAHRWRNHEAADNRMRLETLKLGGHPDLTDETVAMVFTQHRKTLRHLSLADCGPGVTDRCFLSGGVVALETLSLCRLENVTHQALMCLAGRFRDAARVPVPLEAYVEGGCWDDTRARDCLRELNLKCCSGVEDLPEGVAFPNLTRLNAKGLTRVEPEAWTRFSRGRAPSRAQARRVQGRRARRPLRHRVRRRRRRRWWWWWWWW